MSQKIQNQNSQFVHEQTIVAQCTPRGPGAIAIVRLSGFDAISIADSMAVLSGSKKLSDQKSHTIHFGYVVDSCGQHIDQVLFLLMKAPNTFTGQDVVEITCHNNQFLIDAIIDRAIVCGARLAGPGEFAQCAVENGKMDLIQAEAMNDLIHAQTAESLKYSLSQLEGTLSSWIKSVEQSVIEMLAFCEASFEFLDEDGIEFVDDITIKMVAVVEKVDDLLKTYSKQQYIKEGVRIALIGSVNVGKSSLFNCLINKKRSIVTDIAGTTRDIVESGMYKNSGFLTFVDTAGIRVTDDQIEKEGVERSRNEIAQADIILLILDGSKELLPEEIAEYQDLCRTWGHKIIVVQNKMDLINDLPSVKCFDLQSVVFIQVSAKDGSNIDKLHDALDQKMNELKGSGQVTCLLNERQYILLATFLKQLQKIQTMLQCSVDYELLAYHLRESLQFLSEVSGRSVAQAALDQVFKSFCVGK